MYSTSEGERKGMSHQIPENGRVRINQSASPSGQSPKLHNSLLRNLVFACEFTYDSDDFQKVFRPPKFFYSL